jgi:ribosomal protein L35AE/L33A
LRKECRVRVFENRALRRIFWPKRDEVTGKCTRLYNKELYALYFSPNIIWVIRSKGMRRVGHVALTGERRGAYRVLMENPDDIKLLGRPNNIIIIIIIIIILKWIFVKWDRAWIGWI